MTGEKRFLQLADVAEVLNISASQTYALVRSGDLAAIKIGGRGQWRVEASELESYIQRMYAETKEFVQSHPLDRGDVPENEPDSGELEPETFD
jgi:excisionase family DNA binding protein